LEFLGRKGLEIYCKVENVGSFCVDATALCEFKIEILGFILNFVMFYLQKKGSVFSNNFY
jgi:hypothetical protein